MDLLGLIDEWGRTAPDRVAHISGTRQLTYAELCRRSDAVAAHLAEQLGGDHSPVPVIGHKEPEMLIAFLGAAKAGHPYVPLDTVFPPDRIDGIVAAAGARIRLTPALIAELPDRPIPTGVRPVEPDHPYYIIFTSGSTGQPKGVVITLRCLTTFLGWMLAEQRFEAGGETFLNQAPFSFDLSVMDLYLSLATGGSLFSVTNNEIGDFKQLFRALHASSATTWVSTPSFAQMCTIERAFQQSMLPRLRRFLFCGETLPHRLASELLDRFPEAEVWNTYGPTETTVAVTSVRIDQAVLSRDAILPVGVPMPGATILLDEMCRNRGEIIIAGSNVSPGYFGRPDLTAAVFTTINGERAYRTGDWGRFEDGLLFFEGRIDHQIKLSGYRIEVGEIESVLRAIPDVTDAVVIPRLKNDAITSLAAFVVAADAASWSDAQRSRDLRAHLSGRLPAYMLPRKFVFVEAFPLTPNGKVDRHRLAELLM